jgi:hypothetical protein
MSGVYVLRLTASDSVLTATDDLTVTVNNPASGGLLSVSNAVTPANVNLTTEGAVDWSHWGLSTATSFNHKNNVTQQISNYSAIGSGTIQRYANNPNTYSWSDGTPTATATNTATGVYVIGLNNGFQLTVPADTTQRTLKLYVGLWAAGGKLEATLSDNSAASYIDTSLVNSTATSNRVYSLTYQAASSGQTLTVKWTVNQIFNQWSNVTLQAATLVVSGSPPPNQSPIVNAGSDQTITLPSDANLSGTATDDGLPNPPAVLTTTWSQVSGPGSVTFGNANSLTTTASFSLAGVYVLRLTASDSVLTSTDDLTVTVNNGGGTGLLSGSSANTPTNINLTTEGIADWSHWGLSTATSFNHKNNVTQQISNYSAIGSGIIQRYANNSSSYSWSDGTPTANVSSTTAGLYVIGLNNGFQVAVPADTTQRTLKLYVGLWAAGGKLEATLSDGSASSYIDTSLVNSTGTSNRVYSLTYQAASSGQTLTVKWTVNQIFNQWSNVTLQAASLTVNAPPPNQSPVVNAGNDQTITLPSDANLSGTATDDGLPNPPATLTTTWSKVSGPGSVTFGNANSLTTTASFSMSGVYVLRLTASDSVLTATDDLTVTVNNPASGGLLSGSNAVTPANVNLTTEGTVDWSHWGLSTATSFNHKNNVTQQISNITPLGGGTIQRYANNPNTYSWSDGTPTANVSSTAAGVYVAGANNGFQVTVPADTTQRTLKLYVGLWAAGGKLEATLSDGSASSYIDTSLVNSTGTSNRVYSLTYQAASSGQTLTVKWTVNTTFNQWSNVTLQAAALVNGSANPPPPSSEFQISSSVNSAQYATHIAADGNGNFIVVWHSSSQDGSGWGIYARRYNAAGVPLGNEFQVNTYTLDNQFSARVAIDSSGNFVIVWESKFQDGSGYGIYGQRYNSAGVPLGGEFRINTTTTNDQDNPFIAMAPNGNFVVVWVSDLQDGSMRGIFGQRYDAAGFPQGGEFQVNTYTTNDQKQPGVAMDANGNFVVVWESFGQDGGDKGIYAQRFNALAVPQGSEFRVNTFTANEQSSSWISMTPTGEFVITWSSTGQDGSGFGIFAQRYNAAGVPQGSEFKCNTYTSSDQIYSTVAIAPNGDFVVGWESFGQDGSGRGTYGQRYNAAGVPQSGEFQINTYTTDNQFGPFLATDALGNFIAAWTSYGQDGSAEGVFGKRYDAAGNVLP